MLHQTMHKIPRPLMSKTKQRLNENQQKITSELVEEMLNTTLTEVKAVVRKFTFEPEVAMAENGFYGCDLTKPQLAIIRKEIVNQCNSNNPEWNMGKKHNESPYNKMESVWKFMKVTCEDLILLHYVLEQVESYVNENYNNNEKISRAIHLLCGIKGENRFGGLREIGFNKYEAMVLKTHAHLVGEVLEELCNM